MKRMHWLMALLCVALLILPTLSLAEAGKAEPETKLPTEIITEYTKLDMTPYQGKAVYLNFFTEWCPYCMDEMPDIKKLYENYNPDELQIILVHAWDGEDESNSNSIRQQYGLEDMTFFEDEDMTLCQVVGLEGYPLSLFLGKDGNVSDAYSGKISYEDMAAAVEEMGVSKKDTAAK